MADQRTQAEALAVSIEYGLRDTADAIAWADAQIADCAGIPPIALCDLALAHRENNLDVANLLRRLPGQADKRVVVRRVISDAASALRDQRAPFRDVAGALRHLALSDSLPLDDLMHDAFWFDDGLDLAEERVIEATPGEIVNEMQSRLDRWLENHLGE